jgi:hypothetical protein
MARSGLKKLARLVMVIALIVNITGKSGMSPDVN